MTDPKQDLPALIARVRDDAWGSACSDRGPVETARILATALEEQMAENAQLRAERDMPCAHRLEEERLEAEVERLREALSANLESAKDGYMLGGAAARAALVTVVETARAALEGKP